MNNRPIEWLFERQGNTLGETAMRIRIVDHGAGEFIELHSSCGGESLVSIDAAEWPNLRATIDMVVAEIQKHETQPKNELHPLRNPQSCDRA